MDGPTKERWLQFCELAAKEQDPAKLLELVQEINRMLQEKEDRLKSQRASVLDSQTGKKIESHSQKQTAALLLAVPPLWWATGSATDELYDSHLPKSLRVFAQRGLEVFEDQL